MRNFLIPAASLLILLATNVAAQGQNRQVESVRYRLVNLTDLSATFVDTRSMVTTSAGKYRTFWMITLSKDLDYLGSDYIQSRRQVDCAERTARLEALYSYTNGDRVLVDGPDIIGDPIEPETPMELAFEFACRGMITPALADMGLYTFSEVMGLNAVMRGD